MMNNIESNPINNETQMKQINTKLENIHIDDTDIDNDIEWLF